MSCFVLYDKLQHEQCRLHLLKLLLSAKKSVPDNLSSFEMPENQAWTLDLVNTWVIVATPHNADAVWICKTKKSLIKSCISTYSDLQVLQEQQHQPVGVIDRATAASQGEKLLNFGMVIPLSE